MKAAILTGEFPGISRDQQEKLCLKLIQEEEWNYVKRFDNVEDLKTAVKFDPPNDQIQNLTRLKRKDLMKMAKEISPGINIRGNKKYLVDGILRKKLHLAPIDIIVTVSICCIGVDQLDILLFFKYFLLQRARSPVIDRRAFRPRWKFT